MGDSANAIKNLPLNIIAKLDSLANVEFHKLTKKLLKERIEEIKITVAKELAKRSSSNANGDNREYLASRPNISAETDEAPNDSQHNFKKPRLNEKLVDKNVSLSRSNSQTSAKSSSVGLKKGAPQRPSFNDLLKLADKPRDSSRPSPERSVPQRSLSPLPQKSESARRSSFSNSSRPLSPIPRSRSKVDVPPAKSNGISRAGNLKQPTAGGSRQPNGNSRPMQSEDSRYNGRSDTRVNSVSREDPRAQRAVDKDDKLPKSNKKEPTKSARVKRKDEEERILEERKRRLREEEERIKLRNQVLAGHANRANDLKTLVTKSHGSTLLSCGSVAGSNYDDRSPPYAQNDRHVDPRQRDPRASRDALMEHRVSVSSRFKDTRGTPDRREGVRRPVSREERSMAARREVSRSRPMHINPYMDDSLFSRNNHRRPSRYDDYDEEEEDDMDDFIDDDQDGAESTDVTPFIKEIFGYDKRRYADFDDDDIQEASYAEIEKEERRSAKLGKLEDAEAERQEKRHQLLKKQRLMSRR